MQVVTGLTKSTTYYVRGYAINSVSVAYGKSNSFSTLTPAPATPAPATPAPVTPPSTPSPSTPAPVTPAPPTPAATLKNGLVAYYPFNGNANDASGNSNNGKVNGATLTSDRNGLANASYNFNVKNWSFGSGGDNIYIPNNPSFNFSEFTISTWVKRTSDGSTIGGLSDLTIISRYEYGYSKPNGETWNLCIEHGTRPTGALVYGQVIEQFPSPAPYFISKSNQTVPLNKWSNIIMTYSKKTINLYINNQLVGTVLNPNITINTVGTSGISIGRVNAANGQWGPFDGSIDDVGIWNRALTAEEIKFLFENDYMP
jgi:hypothetical protein